MCVMFSLKEESKIAEQNHNALLTQIDERINELKKNYESYFLGMLKREPYNERQELERIVRSLLAKSFTNTAHKFKFKQLCARFNTYKQYWNNILRKIEEGTYERDRFKLAHKDKVIKSGVLSERERNKVEQYEDNIKLKNLYNALLDSKQKCKENTNNVYFSNFKEIIDKQTADIKKKYKCKSVDFEIIVHKGKTKLKAFPKKE